MKKYILPEIPTKEMLAVIVRSNYPEDFEAGKEAQRKYGLDIIPPVAEYEIACGQYKRLCGLLEEMQDTDTKHPCHDC